MLGHHATYSNREPTQDSEPLHQDPNRLDYMWQQTLDTNQGRNVVQGGKYAGVNRLVAANAGDHNIFLAQIRGYTELVVAKDVTQTTQNTQKRRRALNETRDKMALKNASLNRLTGRNGETNMRDIFSVFIENNLPNGWQSTLTSIIQQETHELNELFYTQERERERSEEAITVQR
jgi:hypothetical protein